MLWIAFRLYLWPTEHNYAAQVLNWGMVVNCFQIVSLTYWAQLIKAIYHVNKSCELLSDCIFDLLSTTVPFAELQHHKLWIAFRLYLWPTEHNCVVKRYRLLNVVNCFQIVSLTYWAQRNGRRHRSYYCCELLSDCIFDLLSTTVTPTTPYEAGLWIAFRLYLWPTEHNNIIFRT